MSKTTLAAAVVAAISAAAAAHADTVTYSGVSFGDPATSNSAYESGSYQLQAFDTSFGTLTLAEVIMKGKADALAYAISNQVGATASVGWSYEVNGPLGIFERESAGDSSSCPGSCDTSASLTLRLDKTFSFTSAQDLAYFSGAVEQDSFNYLIGANAYASPEAFYVSANVGLQIDVRYTYDLAQPDPGLTPAVPLPAGAPLLIAGLGAFAALRRRQS